MAIDYILGNKEVKERVTDMKIGDRIASDHQPIEVKLKRKRGRAGRKEERRFWREVWDVEGREAFTEGLGELPKTEKGMEEERIRVKEKIREVARKVEEVRGKNTGRRQEWWDEKCRTSQRKR